MQRRPANREFIEHSACHLDARDPRTNVFLLPKQLNTCQCRHEMFQSAIYVNFLTISCFELTIPMHFSYCFCFLINTALSLSNRVSISLPFLPVCFLRSYLPKNPEKTSIRVKTSKTIVIREVESEIALPNQKSLGSQGQKIKIYQKNPTIFPGKQSVVLSSQIQEESSDLKSRLFSSESEGEDKEDFEFSQSQKRKRIKPNEKPEDEEDEKTEELQGLEALEGVILNSSDIRKKNKKANFGNLPLPDSCSFNDSLLDSQADRDIKESQKDDYKSQNDHQSQEATQPGSGTGTNSEPPLPLEPPKPVKIGQIPLPPGYVPKERDKRYNSEGGSDPLGQSGSKSSQGRMHGVDPKTGNGIKTVYPRKYDFNYNLYYNNYKRYGKDKRKYERTFDPGLGYGSYVSRDQLASYVYHK